MCPSMVKFYLPNNADLVDPNYDFIADKTSTLRADRYAHDWYAHEFFSKPIFNGMLMSRTAVPSGVETRIRSVGGVHAFCRLDRSIPVMGDCGAFTYRNEDVPPYTAEESAGYYHDLGFTHGVALDHLIFPNMPVVERERRLRITLDNARSFLAVHEAQGYSYCPVGIAQGWDPVSRRQAVEYLVAMGYRFVALGGVALSNDKEIRATLEAVGPVLASDAEDICCHVFGVARLSLLQDFIRHGITSVDSASPIRRAFLGTGEDNYWLPDGRRYAAIRVPEVKEGAAKKRGIASSEEVLEKSGNSIDELRVMEQRALRMLRSYDQGAAGLEETLDAVLSYDALHGDTRNHASAYRRTLVDRPWQECTCEICRGIGVEIIIFRGNNRNRRRGFHNVKSFFEQFQQAIARQQPAELPQRGPISHDQLTIDFPD